MKLADLTTSRLPQILFGDVKNIRNAEKVTSHTVNVGYRRGKRLWRRILHR